MSLSGLVESESISSFLLESNNFDFEPPVLSEMCFHRLG